MELRRAAELGKMAGLAALLWPALALAQAAPAQEYQIKAAFLYNFARFIEWPAPGPHREAMVFCILGRDPFGPALEQVVLGKTIARRPLVIARLGQERQLKGCDVLFVSPSEKSRMADALRAADDTVALTVSETDGFLAAGGIFNFVLDANRVRFEINEAAARRRGFKISSRLLTLASRVIRK